jgi:hypothetical protein
MPLFHAPALKIKANFENTFFNCLHQLPGASSLCPVEVKALGPLEPLSGPKLKCPLCFHIFRPHATPLNPQ